MQPRGRARPATPAPDTAGATLPVGTVLLPNRLFFSVFVHFFINSFQIRKRGSIFLNTKKENIANRETDGEGSAR